MNSSEGNKMTKERMKFKEMCCSLILLIMLSTLTSCVEKKREFPTGCDVKDLLLGLSDLPEGSYTSSSGEPIPDSTINSAGSSFYINSRLVSHANYWYSLEKYSIRKYEKEITAAKLINADNQPMPTEITINSLIADDFEIECGDDVLAFRCIYVGRYKNYVTVLNSEIAEDALSFAAYQKIIKVLDERMFSCE